jgi:poly-gamma-glutamate capsule biosynthesis protein CapA/YwtB (metallophosphatase superfamily)
MLSLSKHAGVLVSLIAVLLASCHSAGSAHDPASPTPSASPTVAATPAPTPSGVVTIAAVGDIMLARDLTTLMDEHGALYPFERVLPLLQNADLTIANMEGAFTERGTPSDKLYTFRTPPRFAAGLAQAGIDAVSLGNNHTADFGPEGVADTLAALDAAGVRHAGAGMDGAAAQQPAFMEAQGLRIALLSYTDIMENTFAGPDSAGVALATADIIAAGVRAAKAQADVVIVALHSGVEYTDAPQPDQQQLAHAAIDAGALLVLGTHPHALQGSIRYHGGLIIYSLGNFVFDLDANDLANLGPRAFQTAVVYVTLDAHQVRAVRAEPVFIDPAEDRPRPATAGEAAAIRAHIDSVNLIAGEP